LRNGNRQGRRGGRNSHTYHDILFLWDAFLVLSRPKMEVDSFFQLVEGGVPYEVNCEGNIVEDVHIPLFPYVL